MRGVIGADFFAAVVGVILLRGSFLSAKLVELLVPNPEFFSTFAPVLAPVLLAYYVFS